MCQVKLEAAKIPMRNPNSPELIELKPDRGAAPTLRCFVDFQSGAVTGRDADIVREWLDAAIKEGSTPIDPAPSSVPIVDPYRSRTEFAAVFGLSYVLPDDLAELYRAQCALAASGTEDDPPLTVY